MVGKKIAGWKGKLLSNAGREILIKAVAQATPTYTMSCFKLPVTLCDELNSMASNFWWGQKEKERKMAWVSWDKLCTPKMEGGMGFKDLKTFNLALLAKQGWRIQQNPNSLVHKVFKEKYFAGGSFWEAQVGHRPSYVWRSIMAAKDVIMRGSRWVIGNGESVHIWEDRWIPNPDSFKVVSPRGPSIDVVMVSNLINRETREWDVDLVKNTFLPHEAEIVLGILISPRLPNDSLV
ncbi:putative mitochondrial protein AtMg00310 [Castanea sativa]|uniref:putative mitochondrial protein AtMg00310 n=1 Tax=Castanea sativa TaxID=21020 RepID=UPI003F65197D